LADFYQQYMASEKWRVKRSLILKRDGDRCQTCLSTEDLECHHKTYERLGDELPEDLITLCHECHEAITTVIRRRRYEGREISINDHQSIQPERNLEVSNVPEITVSTYERRTNPPAQRSDVRSSKQVFQGIEENQWETRKDGRRSRDDVKD
jgi:hypothetical protein